MHESERASDALALRRRKGGKASELPDGISGPCSPKGSKYDHLIAYLLCRIPIFGKRRSSSGSTSGTRTRTPRRSTGPFLSVQKCAHVPGRVPQCSSRGFSIDGSGRRRRCQFALQCSTPIRQLMASHGRIASAKAMIIFLRQVPVPRSPNQIERAPPCGEGPLVFA